MARPTGYLIKTVRGRRSKTEQQRQAAAAISDMTQAYKNRKNRKKNLNKQICQMFFELIINCLLISIVSILYEHIYYEEVLAHHNDKIIKNVSELHYEIIPYSTPSHNSDMERFMDWYDFKLDYKLRM